jgi:putative phosphonate metabolism protein
VTATAPRYALYWAPPPDHPLAALGAAWLGRDAAGGVPAPRSVLPGLDPALLAGITAAPRRYGLHATLKPPFALAEGLDAAMLCDAVARLAAGAPAVAMPPLRVDRLGSFLALVPSRPCPGLDALAFACVTELDRFRRPPEAAELARRRAAVLDPAEEANLRRWGYPYVLDCFRFHVSLTGPLEPGLGSRLWPILEMLFAPALAVPLALDAVCLFVEPAPGAPLAVARRFALSGLARERRP